MIQNVRCRNDEKKQPAPPRICADCLGPNPAVRLLATTTRNVCTICRRSYCAYCWKPEARGTTRHTVVCATCSSLKDVCQCCLYDLKYGLPVEIRDKIDPVNPQFDCTNRAALLQTILTKERHDELEEKRVVQDKELLQIGGKQTLALLQDKDQASSSASPGALAEKRRDVDPTVVATLQNLYGKRRREEVEAHTQTASLASRVCVLGPRRPICSFFRKGTCSRGENCPYLHRNESIAEVQRSEVAPADLVPQANSARTRTPQDRFFGKATVKK